MTVQDHSYFGIHLSENSISFDTGGVEGKIPEPLIKSCKGRKFEKISVYSDGRTHGLLDKIAQSFNAPTTLDLDLFYASKNDQGQIESDDDLEASEETVRKIFSAWENSGTSVEFRCSNLLLKVFTL